MFVDPAISQSKFRQEVDEFKAQRATYHARGVWLMDDTFPEVFLVMMAVKCAPLPPTAISGIVINFENYDIEPPSVRFVNPLTREPLRAIEVPPLLRFSKAIGPTGETVTGPDGKPALQQQSLLQAEDPLQAPFLCLRGVREYHNHPAHTGDSWWLHRGNGEGRLAHLVNIIAAYGVDQIAGPNFQVGFGGFQMKPNPE